MVPENMKTKRADCFLCIPHSCCKSKLALEKANSKIDTRLFYELLQRLYRLNPNRNTCV